MRRAAEVLNLRGHAPDAIKILFLIVTFHPLALTRGHKPQRKHKIALRIFCITAKSTLCLFQEDDDEATSIEAVTPWGGPTPPH
eukprot:scaffold2927_cov72-Skeletonema_dohrnii-CCMP3373.AAC.2